MEQPSLPNFLPRNPSNDDQRPAKEKIPSPQDLISHYQSQGLDSQEASLKVIEDLQNVLFRVISSNNKSRRDKPLGEITRKVDAVGSRLTVVDMKLDSKPGYVESFAIGLASGVAFRGFESVWPHVVGGISQIWSAVRSVSNSSSSS